MVETCAERTLYDEYLTKTSIRRSKRERAQLRQEAKAAEAARELSDLPDSSEIATSDSE
jgi:hypothetical protein